MTDPADRLRLRIEDIFGDDPATSSDERADGGAPDERGERDDRWYTENRPPHHDG